MAASGARNAEDRAEEDMPPRVFCRKSLDLLENKRHVFLQEAKELGTV